MEKPAESVNVTESGAQGENLPPLSGVLSGLAKPLLTAMMNGGSPGKPSLPHVCPSP